MNQLQKDKQTVENYKTFLNSKLAELQAAMAKNPADEMEPRLKDAFDRIISGINLELQYVDFRNTQLDQQINGQTLLTAEVVDGSEDVKATRTLN